MIDITKLQDYKWCARGILVAVFRFGSRWFRSESSWCEKRSALDGVLRPSSLLTGSTKADRALGRAWRRPVSRWAVMLLGGVGVLAFLLSAVLPDDDAIQQEFLHSRVIVRVVGRHTREVAGKAASVYFFTAFAPTAKYLLVRPDGIAYPLFVTPLRSCGQFQSTTCATRAPPVSV